MLVRGDVDAYFVLKITVVHSVFVKSVKVDFKIHISSIYDFILLVDEEHIVCVVIMMKDVSVVVVIVIVNQFRIRDTKFQIVKIAGISGNL